ncbi:MAG: TonB-dependent receptor plug domain-containing protein [Gemmatimonadota bacterium]
MAVARRYAQVSLMRRTPFALILITALISSACASAGTQSAPRSDDSRDRNVISLEEIEACHEDNVYHLVQRLRPTWLRGRGVLSFTLSSAVRVYVNDMYRGNVDSLKDLVPTDVARVEFLNAANATARYGTGHTNGVILVILR